MNSDIWTPSYKTGYARNAAESAYPHLWNGLVGAWVPGMGVTGNRLMDLSGGGNHGAIDGATWVPGRALEFDGANDYVLCKGSNYDNTTILVNAMATGSLEKQDLYADSNDTNTLRILDDNILGRSPSYWFKIDTSYYRAYDDNTRLDFNIYHQICGTYNGNIGKLYINGKLGSNPIEVAGALNASGNDMMLGVHSSKGINFLNGHISSALLYNRALTPAEIQQLYEDPYALFRLASSFVPYTIGTPPPVTYEYELESSLDNLVFDPLAIVPAGDQLYDHIGLDHGTQYFYRLRTNEVGAPENSSPWVYATATTVPIVYEYEIESSLDGITYVPLTIVPAGDQSYLNTGLTPNTQYFYRIRSRDVAVPTDISSWEYADATTLPEAGGTFQRLARFQTKTPGIRIFN